MKLPRRVPGDVMLAMLLLVGCEVAARVTFQPDGSLRQLLEGYVVRLNDEQPQTWVCGNSTMNAGIDAEVMQQSLKGSVIKLAHGTATFRASVDLIEYYLSQTNKPPQTLIVCSFKDDLNPNGYNARTSERFDEVLSSESGHESGAGWLRLDSARNRIVLAAQTFLSSGWRTWNGNPVQSAAAESGQFSGAAISAGDPFYTDSARNYEVDVAAFDRLNQLAKRYRIRRCVVLFLPTSQPYIDFHNSLYPRHPYDAIRAELSSLCAQRGLEFIDEGGPWSDSSLFQDPYHLNTEGRRELMSRLMPQLTPLLSYRPVP
ncbi:MAG: hypothetical protein R3B91_20070 [Planctomycetaceae bacterium]